MSLVPKTWSKFVVQFYRSMHNLCKAKKTLLQCARASEILCEVRCCTTRKDPSEADNVKHKKCSQSEPLCRQDQHRSLEETPALLAVLNAVDLLDARLTDKQYCNKCKEQVDTILESPNSLSSGQPSIIGCNQNHFEVKSIKNLASQHMFYSKDHTQLQQTEIKTEKSLGNPPVQPEKDAGADTDRSYIINIFLNDQKRAKTEKESVDVHVKNLDIKPDEVCVKKLAENIHKSYPAISKILQNMPEQNNDVKQLVQTLERVWGDVFKDSVTQIPPLARNKENKYAGVIQDRKVVYDDDPIVRAARIDEAIKSNSLYKKQKHRSKSFASNFDDTSGGVGEDFETKRIVDVPIEKKQENVVVNDAGLANFDIETEEKPEIKVSAPIMETNVFNNKNDLIPEMLLQGKSDTQETKQVKSTPKIKAITQDSFDPILDNNQTLVEKDLIKEQISKYKPVAPKLEIHPPLKAPPPKSDKTTMETKTMAAEDENVIVEEIPIDFPQSEILRPVPLTMGNRLKRYNKKTQEQIEEVIKLAEMKRHQNALGRMMSFCKGLLKDERLVSRLPKFLRQEDFIDGQIRPKRLFKSDNPSVNLQYRSFIQESAKAGAKKLDVRDDNEANISNERKMATMARPEEVFGSQHEFQQRCGVRERILPSSESSFFKGGQRKFSYYTKYNNSEAILQNQLQNRLDISSTLYAFQRFYATKDKGKGKGSKDPCSNVDEKAELKPCSSGSCKKNDKSRSSGKEKGDCDKKTEAKTRSAAKEGAECPDEQCETFKCETDAEIDKIVAGEIGCTAKCLANRVPDEKAQPDKVEEDSDVEQCDPRYDTEVEPEVPKFDVMRDLGKYVKADNKEVQTYYGKNGYKNLEYFQFNRHSFYDIQRHLAKSRNPQPDPHAQKKAEELRRLKAMEKKKKDTSCTC